MRWMVLDFVHAPNVTSALYVSPLDTYKMKMSGRICMFSKGCSFTLKRYWDCLTSKRLICVLSYSNLVSSSRILASWRLTRDFSTMDCSWNSSWLCSEWSCAKDTKTHTFIIATASPPRAHAHTQSNTQNTLNANSWSWLCCFKWGLENDQILCIYIEFMLPSN